MHLLTGIGVAKNIRLKNIIGGTFALLKKIHEAASCCLEIASGFDTALMVEQLQSGVHLHRTAFPGTARQGRCGAAQVSKLAACSTICPRIASPWGNDNPAYS
jgi:hypothetical protein